MNDVSEVSAAAFSMLTVVEMNSCEISLLATALIKAGVEKRAAKRSVFPPAD